MIIRKFLYNISYSHILSFKDDYKKITAPYFGWNKVKYTVEQQNTIHESLKLIFTEFNTAMVFRKDGITIMFEGSESDFVGDRSLIKEFFVMYDKITQLECFSRTSRHDLLVHAVDTSKSINESDFLKFIPSSKELIEFACVYHYHWDKYEINLSFGNFILADIEKYDLMPFKTEHNSDLLSAESGKMCEIRLIVQEKTPSFSKLKRMVRDTKNQIQLIK